MNEQNQTQKSGRFRDFLYRTTLLAAGIAAAFCAIVTIVLIVNFAQRKIIDTGREAELEEMRTQIRANPENEELVEQFRQLDLRWRSTRMQRLGFSRQGAYMLAGGLAVLVVLLKLSSTIKPDIPQPETGVDKQQEHLQTAGHSRVGIAVGFVILGATGLLLGFLPSVDFGLGGKQVPQWPTDQEIANNWPSFRGPNGAGISHYTNIPTKWDGKTGEGIRWKTKVPLPGHNSPVIWGDRIFLSGADDEDLSVFCFDANDGGLLWTGDVPKTLPGADEDFSVMEDTGLAASTMVTDGARAAVIYATGDVACFDYNGRRLWHKALGLPDSIYGYASSLAIYRNLIIVQYDQGMAEDEKSKLIGLDSVSGVTVWETKRPVPNSWSSPVVTKIDGKDVILTAGNPWVIAYDAATGAEIWRAECLSGDACPSPVYADGLVYAIEPYTRLAAIKTGGTGDVTETHIAWFAEDFGPDVCCPLAADGWALILASEGTAACYSAADGKNMWEKQYDYDFMASPSLVDDKLYLLAREGIMFIGQAGDEYKEITKCELGENCYATPAFVDGRIIIRGEKNLYCIGNTD